MFYLRAKQIAGLVAAFVALVFFSPLLVFVALIVRWRLGSRCSSASSAQAMAAGPFSCSSSAL